MTVALDAFLAGRLSSGMVAFEQTREANGQFGPSDGSTPAQDHGSGDQSTEYEGAVQELTDRGERDARAGEVQDMMEMIGPDVLSEREEAGYAMTAYALEGEGGCLLATSSDDMIAGALEYHETNAAEHGIDAIYVDYLGSTHIEPGTGTALAKEAAKVAADKGLPLMGSPTSDAEGFWDKIGWVQDPTGEGGDWWGMDAFDTAQFARS